MKYERSCVAFNIQTYKFGDKSYMKKNTDIHKKFCLFCKKSKRESSNII